MKNTANFIHKSANSVDRPLLSPLSLGISFTARTLEMQEVLCAGTAELSICLWTIKPKGKMNKNESKAKVAISYMEEFLEDLQFLEHLEILIVKI
jgi:hypothetical protein